MITTVKIVRAHLSALYWKQRAAKCDQHMRKSLDILSTVGSGKHETEHGFFTVSENNQYPAEKIQAQLSKEEIDLCMEKKWSNTKARILFPVAYLSAKEQRGYKVTI